MRKVNKITWDLVKKELNINPKNGEIVTVCRACTFKANGLVNDGSYFKLIAR